MQVEYHSGHVSVILPETINLTNAPKFKQALKGLCEQGCYNIHLDFGRMKMIDSAGLGSLVLYQKKLQEQGGELKLVNIKSDYIKHLFEMINLQQVIKIE